jgi:Zn-dependent protease/CBS domain-containing protein
VRGAVRLGRVAGIPVAAHWSALVGVALLAVVLASSVLPSLAPGHPRWTYGLAGALAAAALIGSLLAHEAAHAVVARRRGIGVRRITLWLLGGVSELTDQPAEPATEVRIAIAGPGMSLALGASLAAATIVADGVGATDLAVATLFWLATVNVILAVFNLLPGSPLDGGRLVHGLVWRRTGDRGRATRSASTAGAYLGAMLAGVGIVLALNGRLDGLWLALIGWFVAGTAWTEGTTGMVLDRLGGLRAADVMSAPAGNAPGWWTVEAFVEHLLGDDGPRHRFFPVEEIDGRFVGVVSLTDLSGCPAPERRTTAVRELARPLPAERVLDAGAPLEWVLRTPLRLGHGMAVVVADGRVVGVITATDVLRTVELGALAPDRSPTPP